MFRHPREAAAETAEAKEEKSEKREIPDHFDPEDKYKLKPETKYEASGYYYETDRQGRIVHAEGTLRLDKETKANLTHQRKAGGADRRTKEGGWETVDDGGHYFARRFGGSGKIDNLFAQDRHFNRSDYKTMEDEFEKKLQEKNEDGSQKYTVHVRIQSKYEGNSQRPTKIYVKAKFTDSEGYTQYKQYSFKNEADDNPRIKTR